MKKSITSAELKKMENFEDFLWDLGTDASTVDCLYSKGYEISRGRVYELAREAYKALHELNRALTEF